MVYLSAEFFFLDHIVFVTNVFSFVAILFGVKIKFDITSEFVCVSSKWLVMFHFISHKIQIEKSTLFPIWRRSQPKIKFSDFPRPFHWPNKSIISSPHIRWMFDAIQQQFWMHYLNPEFFFLYYIVFVTNIFCFRDISIVVKIIFNILSELFCVSSKWLVMSHVVSH